MTLTIATISDIHGQWRRPIYPPADVLVFAGDILKTHFGPYNKDGDAEQQLVELEEFVQFVGRLDYDEIIVVAGNHDFVFERLYSKAVKILRDAHIHYLQDSYVDILPSGEETVGKDVKPIRFYGSPYTPFFHSWAFNMPARSIEGGNDMRANARAKEIWRKIPDNTNVLITHGPPHGILDECPDGRRVGCPYLRERIRELSNLRLSLFGHIHCSAGMALEDGVLYKNTAILGEDYTTMADITVETITIEDVGQNPSP